MSQIAYSIACMCVALACFDVYPYHRSGLCQGFKLCATLVGSHGFAGIDELLQI